MPNSFGGTGLLAFPVMIISGLICGLSVVYLSMPYKVLGIIFGVAFLIGMVIFLIWLDGKIKEK